MARLVSPVASSKYSARPGASTAAVTSDTGRRSHSDSRRSVLGPGPWAVRPSGNVITVLLDQSVPPTSLVDQKA
jgi:hypothetical protein